GFVPMLLLNHAQRCGAGDNMKFRLRLPARLEVAPPSELRTTSAKLDEEHRRGDRRPEQEHAGPIMKSERSQGADSRQDKGNPFRLDPEKHFDIRKNRGEGNEDTEVNHAGAGHSEPRPEAGQGEEKRGHPEEQSIEDKKSAPANGTSHPAAEREEQVPFNREP